MAMCYSYDYGVFENFEATKATFVAEQKTLQELLYIRANFHGKINTIARALHGLIVSTKK